MSNLKPVRNFICAILDQKFFDIERGSIVDLTYVQEIKNGTGTIDCLPAFHQRRSITREDGTEIYRDVVWVWSGNLPLGHNGKTIVPVGEGEIEGVSDRFVHNKQCYTGVAEVRHHPLDSDDPSKGEFLEIIGKEFEDAGETFTPQYHL